MTPEEKEALTVQLLEAQRWQRKAEEYLKDGYLDYAIEAFTKSLEVSLSTNAPASTGEIYAGLADAQARKGLYKQADANYRLAVGLVVVPNRGMSRERDGDLQIRYALMLSKLERYEEAIKMYEWGVTLLKQEEFPLLGVPFSRAKTFNKNLFERRPVVL
jgi:tetratricopeptide (TPR) repeat protein